MNRFAVVFAASLVVAALEILIQASEIAGKTPGHFTGITVFPLSLLWIGLTAWAIFKFKGQGLWLLIGAPFALWWPWIVGLFVLACRPDCL